MSIPGKRRGLTTREILQHSAVIAVVGLSRDPNKDAHHVPARMQRAGWRVIPVNPHAAEILGERSYGRLEQIPEPVDLVNVFRPSEEAADVARQAAAIGAKALWLQLGIASPEARRIAEAAGMHYVEDRCIAVERSRYGITRFS
jgi:uncharacterized protein